MDRALSTKLMALVPIYKGAREDSTLVYIRGEAPFVLDIRIKSLMDRVCSHYMVDQAQVKKLARQVLGSKYLSPIPFDQENVFICVKTRTPRVRGDRAFAYVNLRLIDQIKGGESTISFVDSQKLEYISKEASLYKHIRQGRLLGQAYRRPRMERDQDPLAPFLPRSL